MREKFPKAEIRWMQDMVGDSMLSFSSLPIREFLMNLIHLLTMSDICMMYEARVL